MTKKYVFYHANCNDGFGAALAAWKYLGSTNVVYIPIKYGGPIPEIPEAYCDIYILDFCFSVEVTEKWAESHNIYILDHHKTSELTTVHLSSNWPNIISIHNLNKSGAMLAWEYFHPDRPAPLLFRYIEDRDLWKFKYGTDTQTVYNALNVIDRDFVTWNSLLHTRNISDLISKYSGLQAYIDKQIDGICGPSFTIDFHGHKTEVRFTSIHISEVGSKLVESVDIDIALMIYIENNESVKVSLRSRKGGVDVSAIAEKYGGGGHHSAAGFETKDLSFLGGMFEVRKSRTTKTIDNGEDQTS